jgi:uncharacterized protein YciI
MRLIITLLILIAVNSFFAQTRIPDFLQGTWKMENEEIFEHWDKINETTLKGFSYKVKDGKILVSEYLDITNVNDSIIYTATVLNQNQGKGVHFTLKKTDSTYSFENANHDFPKKIVYRKLNESEISVLVSDGKNKGFSYKMRKQFQEIEQKDSTISNSNYDKVLANKLGGDDNGMKSYFLVILKTGTNTSANKEIINESFRGHMENINRLVKQGNLVVAGPLGKNENNYRGIFILNNVKSLEEAKLLLQTDPAVNNGLLDYEIFTWYGSAALPEYLPFSEKIMKTKP